MMFDALDNPAIAAKARICGFTRAMSGVRGQEGSAAGQSSGNMVSNPVQFVTMAATHNPLKSQKITLQNLTELLLIEKTQRR